MQNYFASLMLCAWPLVAIYLFATQSVSRAILWTLMGAQLALPVGAYFKLEMIPQFDKNSIPNLCALLGCLVITRRPLRIISKFGVTELLILTFLIGPIFTSVLNEDPTVIGAQIRPGVGLYDALSYVESSFIYMIPFFLGRQFLARPEDVRDIVYVLAIAGLLYSLPLLYEIRMSPTLQFQIYGFAATDFVMTARGGGYRPMAFMGHGLVASFFVMTTVLASAALWRLRCPLFKIPPGAVSAYLGVVLLLCKSFGAMIYGLLLVPILRWTSPRTYMRVAVALASVALLYPALRSSGLFPTESLVQAASVFSSDRADSLSFRFANEDKLLDRAFERPIFGWGRYGRNRVYSGETGQDESVTDGLWVITIGQFGLCGFIAQFGLLSIGVFRAAFARSLIKTTEEMIFLGTLALIVAANVVELIPNSGLLPWSWLLSGALLGTSEIMNVRVNVGKSRFKFDSALGTNTAKNYPSL